LYKKRKSFELTVYFTNVKSSNYRTAWTYDRKKNWEFWFAVLNHGIITPAGLMEAGEQWLVSAAHTKKETSETIEIMENALRQIK
jgi:glutamate-1-semialdehyde aminotransferase